MRWLWFLLLAGVLFFHFGNYWIATWYSKWLFLSVCAALFFSGWVGKKISWWLTPAFAYSLLSMAYLAMYGQNMYAGYSTSIFVALGKNSLYAGLIIVAIGLIWMNFKRSWELPVQLGLVLICAASAVATICLGHAARDNGYFSGNASMNGALIAALLPFMWLKGEDWLGWMFTAMCAVAIYFTHANVPLGTLVVAAVSYRLASRSSILHRTQALAAPILAGLAGYLYLGHKFLNDDGRFGMWRLAVKAWEHPWLGEGLGSGIVLFPLRQLAANQTNYGLFLWLHCEPLQTLFELGIIGAVCVLLAWGFIAYRAFRCPPIFASFMAFSAMSVFDYPCRLPIHATAWVLICGMALAYGSEDRRFVSL